MCSCSISGRLLAFCGQAHHSEPQSALNTLSWVKATVIYIFWLYFRNYFVGRLHWTSDIHTQTVGKSERKRDFELFRFFLAHIEGFDLFLSAKWKILLYLIVSVLEGGESEGESESARQAEADRWSLGWGRVNDWDWNRWRFNGLWGLLFELNERFKAFISNECCKRECWSLG